MGGRPCSAILIIFSPYTKKRVSAVPQRSCISPNPPSAPPSEKQNGKSDPDFQPKNYTHQFNGLWPQIHQAAQTLYLLRNDLEHYISEMKTSVKGQSCHRCQQFLFHLSACRCHFRVPQKEFPEVKIELFENVTPYLQKRLDSQFIDLMITNPRMDRSRYRSLRLFDDHLYVMVLPKFCPEPVPLKKQADFQKIGTAAEDGLPAISLEAFGQTPFLLLREGNNLRRCTDELFHEASILHLSYWKWTRQILCIPWQGWV